LDKILPEYEEIINIIVSKTGKSKKEIEDQIKTFSERFPFSRPELLAYLYAKQLGVNIPIKTAITVKEELKIKDITEDYEGKSFTISGYVVGKMEGTIKKTGNRFLRLILADDTGLIPTFIWGGKTGELVDNFSAINLGEYITISNARIMIFENGDLVLSCSGNFVDYTKNSNPPYSLNDIPKTSIKDLVVDLWSRIEGIIIHQTENYYLGCPNCLKKLDGEEGELTKCGNCGKKVRINRLSWIEFILSDDSGDIKCRIPPGTKLSIDIGEGVLANVFGRMRDDNSFEVSYIVLEKGKTEEKEIEEEEIEEEKIEKPETMLERIVKSKKEIVETETEANKKKLLAPPETDIEDKINSTLSGLEKYLIIASTLSEKNLRNLIKIFAKKQGITDVDYFVEKVFETLEKNDKFEFFIDENNERKLRLRK